MKKRLAILITAVIAFTVFVLPSYALLSVVEENEGKAPHLVSGEKLWLAVLYSNGKADPEKPVTDFGIDVETITTLRITFKVSDKDLDFWDPELDAIGGALVLSCKVAEATEEVPDPQKFYTQHNWNKREFWGVGPLTDYSKDAFVVDNGDGTYTVGTTFPEIKRLSNKADLVQVALQEWGDSINHYDILRFDCLDENGYNVISFDKFGNATIGLIEGEEPYVVPKPPVIDVPLTLPSVTTDESQPEEVTTESTSQSEGGNKGLPTGVVVAIVVGAVAVVAAVGIVIVKKLKK